MSGFEHGPLRSYEVTWTSGHVETIKAHQVTWPNSVPQMFGGESGPAFIRFMGEVDGQWTLVLQAREAEIAVVRDVTSGEVLQ